jgi:hypothetical protein
MSQFWKLVSLPVLVASSFGCSTDRAAYEGRLDVLVRPDTAEASHRRIEGSFALRTPEGRIVDRLVIVNPYDTLSIALPEGPYLLEWQPALALPSTEEVAARARESAATGTPLSVVAGRVTTVHAKAVVTRNVDVELAAFGRDIPSVDIVIARH